MPTYTKWPAFLLILFLFFSCLTPVSPAAEPVTGDNLAVQKIPALICPNSANAVNKNLQWNYGEETFSWEVQMPLNLIIDSRDAYKAVSKFYSTASASKQKEVLAEYDQNTQQLMLSLIEPPSLYLWTGEKANAGFVALMAECLQEIADDKGFDSYQTADFVFSLVASIPYKITNYPELPVQTLVDGGDCKGKSILLASILNNMGYQTKFFLYKPSLSSPKGHMAVGVAFDPGQLPDTGQDYHKYVIDDTNYYFAETTSTSGHIGDVRYSESRAQAQIISTALED